MSIHVELIEGALDCEAALRDFRLSCAASGAIASFSGLVRPMRGEQQIDALELQHYPRMTLPQMQQAASHVRQRHNLDALLALHRIGQVEAHQPIVLVAAAASHRRAAFDGMEMMMAWLKCHVLLWKCETGPDYRRWIEPVDADRQEARQLGWDGNGKLLA